MREPLWQSSGIGIIHSLNDYSDWYGEEFRFIFSRLQTDVREEFKHSALVIATSSRTNTSDPEPAFRKLGFNVTGFQNPNTRNLCKIYTKFKDNQDPIKPLSWPRQLGVVRSFPSACGLRIVPLPRTKEGAKKLKDAMYIANAFERFRFYFCAVGPNSNTDFLSQLGFKPFVVHPNLGGLWAHRRRKVTLWPRF